MRERNSYPVVDGSVNLGIEGRRFSIEFRERTIEIKGKQEDLISIIPKVPDRLRSFHCLHKISSFLSKNGITLKIDDDRGTILSFGKGIWTPLGHFSFKPRLRKYLRGD